MSGNVLQTQGNPPIASTPLTQAERVDARRFCGFPAYGVGSTYDQIAFGPFEFRLTNMSDADLVVIRKYLVACNKLECDILGSADNLDTDQAAVWTRNRSEVRDRERLFDGWRRRLCDFVGVRPGPLLDAGNGRIVI